MKSEGRQHALVSSEKGALGSGTKEVDATAAKIATIVYRNFIVPFCGVEYVSGKLDLGNCNVYI